MTLRRVMGAALILLVLESGAAFGDSTVVRPRAAATAAKKAAPARRAGEPSSRRLEDIHIAGEIPVPQVLFITARDQRRVVDFKHERYRRTARALGESTVLPARIVVAGSRPAAADQEPAR